MTITIKDVARRAGVSPSTVSRAMANHPRISKDTTEAIQNLAKEMGYVPSAIARSLVSNQSNTIGVAVNDFLNPFYVDLISNIEEAVQADNYHVFVGSFHRNRERELSLTNAFYERRLTGTIVVGSLVDQTYLNWPARANMPVVLVSCPTYPFSVSVDNYHGVYTAMAYLIESGHRRIAFVTQGHRTNTEHQRLKGYRAALHDHQIPADETLIVHGDGSITGGIGAVPEILALSNRPTAIFCYNDMTAIGVINGLQHRGYKVPDDYSVVGFDDLGIAAAYSPALTTVRQPTDKLGQFAVDLLRHLAEGNTEFMPTVIKPELIVRQSTTPIC